MSAAQARNAESTKPVEPSMEEILASIRKIIADESPAQDTAAPAAPPAAPPPVAAPPQAVAAAPPPPVAVVPPPAPEPAPAISFVDEDEDVLDLAALPAEPAPPPPPIQAAAPPPPANDSAPMPDFVPLERPEPQAFIAPPPVAPPPAPIQHASPQPAASAPVGAGQLLSGNAQASVGGAFQLLSNTILSQNARTLDDVVHEMLRPMLQGWLDQNLPTLVERLVRAEIERVARGGR